jgi:hypothetical protein
MPREELWSENYFIQLGEHDDSRIRLADRKMYSEPSATPLPLPVVEEEVGNPLEVGEVVRK